MEYDINDERTVRVKRLEELKQAGINPYPSQSNRNLTVQELEAGFQVGKKAIILAGRIRGLRRHGGSTFLDLQDSTGNFQIFCSKNEIGVAYSNLVVRLDIGDFIETTGEAFLTKSGQKSLRCEKITLLSKALRPLPDKIHGLIDIEQRYRQRELDFLANPESKLIALTRVKILKVLRNFLEEAGFIEVETPILQTVAGGANAKPFVTRHNALKADLFLRVAPELHLKRLIIAGFEKVYEVARCFRNEGLSPQHNPEFTQVEFYAAFWDYKKLMLFCEELMVETVERVKGKLSLEVGGKLVNFEPPFPRISYVNAIKDVTNIDVLEASDKELKAKAKQLGAKVDSKTGRGRLIDEIWKIKVRPDIHHPTFVCDFPVELSPLAKRKADDPRLVEMFQLVIAGVELIKAFSELNDPLDQHERFKEQEALKKKGDEEAQGTDQLFVEAMEYGMPPTAGAGLGIDRLASILTGSHSIKEVILFPTLKPGKNQK